jgi:hypothetical protein
MADDRTPHFEDLPASRQSLWNGLMGLAAMAALIGIVGVFLPIIQAAFPLLVAAGAWFGARRAAREPLGILDWVTVGLGGLLLVVWLL